MAWVAVGLAVAGAVAGKMKNDQAKAVEGKQIKLASETQRYSPWTGMSAGPVQHAGAAGSDIFAGGVQGAMVGSSLSKGMNGMNAAPLGTDAPTGLTAGGGMGAQEQMQTMSPEEQMQQQDFMTRRQTMRG